MKSPFKQQENALGNLKTGPSQASTDPMADLSFDPEIALPQNLHFRETGNPQVESFRALIKSRLSKEKAPQALMDRIRHTIQKTPA